MSDYTDTPPPDGTGRKVAAHPVLGWGITSEELTRRVDAEGAKMTEEEIEARLDKLRNRREDLFTSINDAEERVRHAQETLAHLRNDMARLEDRIETVENMQPDRS